MMERSRELGKLISDAANELHQARGWKSFVHARRGRTCLASTVADLPHPAASLLNSYRTTGVTVELDAPPWSRERLDQALQRGSHPSASQYQGFLEADMADMIKKNYWVVLPYKTVKDLPGLRASPFGVVPQRARRPRPIVDYTYYGINDETVPQAPEGAMQFGRALSRMLYAVHTAHPKHGPVYMLKLDQSDGFYRIPLAAEGIPKLAVAFPTQPGEEPLMALPLVLPMGWTESPPAFCAATETVTDIANELASTTWDPPPHHLELEAATPPEDLPAGSKIIPPPAAGRHTRGPPPPLPRNLRRRRRCEDDPIYHADVFVDDGLLAAQGTAARLNRYRRQLLHINDHVFRPNDAQDPPERKEPVSRKKLKQGDACWATYKQILGWEVDTIQRTLNLPPHRKKRLLDILEAARDRVRWSKKFCYKLLGELRSMLLAIPGGSGLFSHLQHSLSTALGEGENRFRPSAAARQELDDWQQLARDITSRPTRLAELFPKYPGDYYGATDAAKSGFGGIILPKQDQTFPPYVWRAPLPEDLKDEIVATENPQGTITNSDLELAATILHEAVMDTALDVAERTIYTGCDNTPAVSWRGTLLENATAAARDAFEYDLRAAKAKSRQAVNPDRAKATDSLFNRKWIPYLQGLNIDDEFLTTIDDKIPVLRVFAQRIRDGRCSRSGKPVRGAHVRDEILHIAKAFTELGYQDPRLTRHGIMDPRLSTLYKAYSNEDPAPVRVKPLPIQVLFKAQALANSRTVYDEAVVAMAWIGFFYLLRPGEYCKSNENKPIQLKHITLLLGHRKLDALNDPIEDITRATHSSITFDDQKNREKGEVIGHGTSGHSTACPTRALVRRVEQLRQQKGTPNTALCAVRDGNKWKHVTSAMVTAHLRTAAATIPHLNYRPDDVSARSLRAGGAMALLCGKVDQQTIQLVGRWKSAAVFRYLHAQALPLVHNLAGIMLQHGAFTLLPGQDVPTEARVMANPQDAWQDMQPEI